MKTSKEYRAEAKAALKGNWLMVIVGYILYGVILSAASSITFGIGTIIIGGALTIGFCTFMLTVIREKTTRLEDLFEGFKNGNFGATIVYFLLLGILVGVASMLFVIPGIIVALGFAMAPYIMADHKELSGWDALKASWEVMKGKKWKLFCLYFSFIGWFLLCILTLGILSFWVLPWVEAATASFYESIKDEVKTPELV